MLPCRVYRRIAIGVSSAIHAGTTSRQLASDTVVVCLGAKAHHSREGKLLKQYTSALNKEINHVKLVTKSARSNSNDVRNI